LVELGAAWAIRRTAAPGVETAADPMGDRVRSLQLTLWPFRQRHPLGRSEAAPGQSAADSSFGDSKFSDSRLDPLQAGLDLVPGSSPLRRSRSPARHGTDRPAPAPGSAKPRVVSRPPR
jgi:hypothetical protein